MSRSRTIWVLKRDGTSEPFDRAKLRGCLLRALGAGPADVNLTDALAAAVQCYLWRRRHRCVSSAAVLEMALTALRTVHLPAAARRLEDAHTRRSELRRRLSICHLGGNRTGWSKHWLVQHARARWRIGRRAARILAGKVEQHFLHERRGAVRREDVLNALVSLADAYGLACQVQPQEAADSA